MKISQRGCKLLEQLLQQFQSSELEQDPIFLTKFNLILHKFHQSPKSRIEKLRELRQAKVYLRYTKKNRAFFTAPIHWLFGSTYRHRNRNDELRIVAERAG